jgi:hypothetical protein
MKATRDGDTQTISESSWDEESCHVSCFTIVLDFHGMSSHLNERHFTHERKSSVVRKREFLSLCEKRSTDRRDRHACWMNTRYTIVGSRNDRMSSSCLQTRVFHCGSRLEFKDTTRSSAENSFCVILYFGILPICIYSSNSELNATIKQRCISVYLSIIVLFIYHVSVLNVSQMYVPKGLGSFLSAKLPTIE